MTAPYIVEQRTAGYNSSTTLPLGAPNSFVAVPEVGDCAYVVTASTRAAGGRTITGVAGLGATWGLVGVSGPAGVAGTPRIELWRGVNPTTNGNVTVTQDVSGELHFTAFLMRGDDADVAVLNPVAVGLNQLAMRYAAVLGGSVTIPSSPVPATGWSQTAASVGSAGSARGAYRTPTEDPAVAHNAGYSGGTSGASLPMSFGIFAAAPPPVEVGRITWGEAVNRRYEAGCDRGVLYVNGDAGVPWDGLISVDESPVGGEATPYYYDGIKYMDAVSHEDFAAQLSCFQVPFEFARCDGMRQLAAGLFATQQRRRKFSLCYRTMMGQAVAGWVGYKLHLVYNVIASPSSPSYKTLNDNPEAGVKSYQLNTTPEWYGTSATYEATAHFIIDSTTADPAKLAELEDILYGSEIADARMPTQAQVISILEA